tara:strand:+ start:254 stop:805 length:552 start_codon:yes stop_codon:yes gene_type:complete
MSLLAFITGATESIAAKTASIESGMSDIYADSPLGKFEQAYQGFENKMLDSPMHRAFQGQDGKPGDFGSGASGASDYSSISVGDAIDNSGYVDATSGLQGVMSQAGIMNPASSQLRGGLPVLPSAPQSLRGGSAASVPEYVGEYEDNLASVPDAPPVPEIIQETTPALIDEDEDLIQAGALTE